MSEILSAKIIQDLTAPFLEKGFSFEYTYEKGGDSSCVYIYRFRKGKDFFDWRETSGTYEIHLVAYVNGEYVFPKMEKLYAKETRAFKIRNFFKKFTIDEKRAFFAKLLNKELENSTDFFGIKL